MVPPDAVLLRARGGRPRYRARDAVCFPDGPVLVVKQRLVSLWADTDGTIVKRSVPFDLPDPMICAVVVPASAQDRHRLPSRRLERPVAKDGNLRSEPDDWSESDGRFEPN